MVSDDLFETEVQVDKLDEAIAAAGDVPGQPPQLTVPRGYGDESQNGVVVEHVAGDDAAPEVHPAHGASPERDRLVHVRAGQVLVPDLGRCLQPQLPDGPLAGLGGEDVELVVGVGPGHAELGE